MEALKKVVLKSFFGEIPFERKRRGLLVPPLSTKTIRTFADQVRSVFVEDEKIEFPKRYATIPGVQRWRRPELYAALVAKDHAALASPPPSHASGNARLA